jgi:uncharacterized protein (UPF0332 family)
VSTALFVWDDFLALADQLVSQAGGSVGEACLRTATSRAYYAAFCKCKSYAVVRFGFAPGRTGDDHLGVKDAFFANGRSKEARSLSELRQWRNYCDYDLQVPGIADMAPRAVAKARALLALLNRP